MFEDVMTKRRPVLRGLFTGKSVSRLEDALSAKGGIEAFFEWRKEAYSSFIADALKELAMQPSGLGLAPHEMAVQYGVTLGLQLASAMLDDPTIVVRTASPEVRLPDPTYGSGTTWAQLQQEDGQGARPSHNQNPRGE
jgi:hypothetical protein